MGASSARPSTSSREMAFRNTEKRQHGNPQLKASGEVAPTICADTSPRTWTRPNTSIEGTACTERRVHPAFAEANCIFGAGTRRRTGVVGQGSGSARTVETGGGSSRSSSRRDPHAGVKHGGVDPQGEGGPIGSRTDPASSPRVHRRGRELAVAVDETQDRELSRGQFADESARSSFLVGGKAVGVARCPRRSRHGISQFVDGTDFQRRLCHEQFAAAVFGGAHGALIRAWREAGYGLRGTRIGEASNPGPRRVRTIQSVGEDVVTSDSDDRPFVGAVVPAPSTPGAHHDCRVGFKVRRMRLTSDRKTHISEATAGESIDDTLLDALELDLSGPGTGSDVPQGAVRINSTQVDSDEEPLMRFAVTQQDAPHLWAGLSPQSPGHGSFPRAGHRRGLVKEVAVGVVDVTAVAMSSGPNAITFVVAADETDFQGPTWVDSDDESMDNEPWVTIAEGTKESDLRARAIRGRFESPPASAVQGSAPSRVRLGQNRFEVLGEEDEQDLEMSTTETTTERLLIGEQMLHTLPLSSGAVRREDANLPIRRLRLVGGNNASQSTTMAQVADPGMGVSHDTVEEDTMLDEEGSSEAHTETIDGASVGDEEPNGRETTVTVDVTPDFPNFGMVPDQNIAAGFESLDEVDLVSIFNRRANVMRSIPHVLKWPYVSAVRIAIREALEARVGGS